MREISYENKVLKIKFNGPNFNDDLSLVKDLIGASFSIKTKSWTASFIKENIEKLEKASWIIPENIKVLLYSTNKAKKEVKIDESKIKDLFDFQKDGVKWLESVDGTGIIADEMGLGKSAQSIGYCKIHPEIRPILIICPSSLKLNWEREIQKWTSSTSIKILSGTTPYKLPKKEWYIINYDILIPRNSREGNKIKIDGWAKTLVEMGIKIVICDESQMISNDSSIRTKAVKYIKKNLKGCKFIALSGTPIRNRPSEFFTVLNLVAPDLFSNRWRYLNRYCNPKFNGFGWQFNGATNIEELHQLITPFMIRRLKSEVLTQLPEKTKSLIPLELDDIDKNKYKDSEGQFSEWLENNLDNFIGQQSQLEKLKQLAYLAKRNAVMQWIEDFLSSGQKLVVMAYHTMAIDDLSEKFKDISVRIDGSTSLVDRQKAVDEFQTNDKIKLFIGQIQAAGVGLTLTAASSLAFIEFTMVPAEHEQAEDRIHRIGQKYPVNIYYLYGEGTVETDMVLNMISSKYKVVKKVIDGESKDFFDKDISFTKGLLQRFLKVKKDE